MSGSREGRGVSRREKMGNGIEGKGDNRGIEEGERGRGKSEAWIGEG